MQQNAGCAAQVQNGLIPLGLTPQSTQGCYTQLCTRCPAKRQIRLTWWHTDQAVPAELYLTREDIDLSLRGFQAVAEEKARLFPESLDRLIYFLFLGFLDSSLFFEMLRRTWWLPCSLACRLSRWHIYVEGKGVSTSSVTERNLMRQPEHKFLTGQVRAGSHALGL